jgi:DNA-binding SARP family transcriptional activator
MDDKARLTQLLLLGGFRLIYRGNPLRVGASSERVLALLAMRRRPAYRRSVTRELWPEQDEKRAAGNLRSVIWRLPPGLVERAGDQLTLGCEVHCDVADFAAWAQRLVDGVPSEALGVVDWEPYLADLLPGWDDDWLLIERERVRQLRIHALDALSACLTAAGRYSDGVAAGLASVEAEPLRETAHRAVITAHLAEGNRSEAIRQYETYRTLLLRELGLGPSPELTKLIRGFTTQHTAV